MTITAEQVYRGSPGLALGRSVITGFVAGRTLKVRLRPVVATAFVRAVWTIKKLRSDSDAAALFKVSIDTTAQTYGQIVAAGPGKTDLQWVMSAAQSGSLGGFSYWFEFAGIDAAGVQTPIDAGTFFLPDFTVDAIDAGNVATVDLTPATGNLLVGSTLQLTATPRDASGVALPGRTIEWFTNNTAIATVDANGLVTATGGGTAYVFARVGGIASYMTLTSSTDDVGLLVGNLGGDTQVPAIFDTRRNVAADGGVVYVWEDARIPVTQRSGYFFEQYGNAISSGLYAGLDGQSRVSVVLWYNDFGSQYQQVGAGNIWRITAGGGGTTLRLSFNTAAQIADIPHPGLYVPYKITVVYDGTQATNAGRVVIYLSTFDRVAKTWSADVLQTVTFTGTFPATWPVSSSQQLHVGGSDADGWSAIGIVDELRVWAGASLTAGQVAAETLTASPAAPNLRYTYGGNRLNTGSTAGYDGVAAGINVPVSCNWNYGPALVARTTAEAPAWDAVNQVITFNDTTNFLRTFGAGAFSSLGRTFGVSVVGVMPTYDGSSTDSVFSMRSTELAAGRHLLESSVQGALSLGTSGVINAGGGAVTTTASLAVQTGRRVLHARRTLTGASNDQLTVVHRFGSLAEVGSATGTVTVFDDPAQLYTGRANSSDGSYADLTLRAIVVKKVTVAADQVFVNNWAATASIHNALLT